MNEENDYELLMLYHENSEEASSILFDHYQRVVRYTLYNYHSIIKRLGIDYHDIYSECINGFSKAINSYDELSDITFKTYINMVIKRTILKIIKSYYTDKRLIIAKTVSFDELKDKEYSSIKDDNIIDPEDSLLEKENIEEINAYVKTRLTKKEQEIYFLLAHGLSYKEIGTILNKSYKQVTTTINRIRHKLNNIRKDLYEMR